MKTVKSLSLIIISICLLCVASIGHARHAAMLVDASNGNVLYQSEPTQAWYPASLTKLMTLYMAFDALNSGKIQLQDSIVTSRHAALQPKSKLYLRTGEIITVEQAIIALVTRSANDAAVALAEHIGGTEDSFAAKMTAKAHAIGMLDTHFMNATGLPHAWQVSTARDLALLAWHTLYDFPDYYPYFSAHSLSFRGGELPAINKFTEHYPGAEGMKTGFTCGSGYNLISTASQNGHRLIGVVLGGMSSSQRYQLMMDMMDAGFAGQYTPNGQHIENPVVSSNSTPPQQLGCGKATVTTASSDTDDDNYDNIPHRAKHQYVVTKTKFHPKGQVGKRGKVIHVSKTKATAKSKTVAKVSKKSNKKRG
ncbi:serine-type D-Ala-D-Ala carboxypeptidase (penicillin-binding protein 5/6) [Patescibacteria group bacterium]|nr:serine-type D-Ala-D-Ala carboxypeptidase (penicillin-binding protein 5/6) [Patescibacteria group bacterium]